MRDFPGSMCPYFRVTADRHWYLKRWQEARAAFALLTRLPIPASSIEPNQAWAYPLVGAALGGAAAIVLIACLTLGLSPTLAALAALMTTIFATGALHEDGLADCADGAAVACGPRDKRLAAMRDTHLGTGGVLALIFSVIARTHMLAELAAEDAGLAASALVIAHVIARATLAGLCAALPLACTDGLAAACGRASMLAAFIALALALIITLLTALAIDASPAYFTLACILAAILAASAVSLWALICLGGQTGDVLGAGEQTTEITVLITIGTAALPLT